MALCVAEHVWTSMMSFFTWLGCVQTTPHVGPDRADRLFKGGRDACHSDSSGHAAPARLGKCHCSREQKSAIVIFQAGHRVVSETHDKDIQRLECFLGIGQKNML